ncbi:hypothetical protein QN345_10945, partial [Cryobacterium sp. 10I1]|nr:hypothetical protein [Cryobacterium sp. 10I1]
SSMVVRVGDTVRRSAGPWTPAVHQLLTALRAAGVMEVPEPFGLDEQGREVLSYLPGIVGNYPMPSWIWSPTILREAGSLLRRVHDASAPLVHAAAEWQLPAHEPVEVVCLNDVAPYNMVFQDGHITVLSTLTWRPPGLGFGISLSSYIGSSRSASTQTLTPQEGMLAPAGSMRSFAPTAMSSTRLPFFGRQRTAWRILPLSRINVPPTRAAVISWSMPHCTDVIATDFST